MKVNVTVPGVGESISEGLLANWLVSDGAQVQEGQALFEMETDKTTIDVTAPAAGKLSITVAAGTDIVIDQVVGTVDTEAVGTAEKEPPEPPKTAEQPKSAEAPKPPEPAPAAAPPGGTPGRITPAAQAAAQSCGVKTAGITGTGRAGLLTKADVLSASKGAASTAPMAESRIPQASREPLSRIRRAIAKNLIRTRDELVLLTTFNEADMSAVKKLRGDYGELFLKKYGAKLGFMSLFLKASAAALETYPRVNASIDGDDIVHPGGVHISVAVSTAKGLITPVVRNVPHKPFHEIEAEIVGFAKKVEDKTLLPEDLQGGTFTITNGGIFGSMMSTPLPAPGQSAILGMHAITERAVVRDGEIVIRPMMYLALSYDHRLIDGREAVGFLKMIKDGVENPERLLLGV